MLIASGATYEGSITTENQTTSSTASGTITGIASYSFTTYNSNSKEFRVNASTSSSGDQYMVITPAKGVTITQIHFTNTNSIAKSTPSLSSATEGQLTYSTTTGECTWNGSTAKAISIKRATQMKIKFVEITYEVESANLGNLTGSFNGTNITENEYYSVEEGTIFNFNASSASSISVKYGELDAQNFTGSTASWTPSAHEAADVTVTATKGTETKTLSFSLSVVKPSTIQDTELTATLFNLSGSGYNCKSYTSTVTKVQYGVKGNLQNDNIQIHTSSSGKGSGLASYENENNLIIQKIVVDATVLTNVCVKMSNTANKYADSGSSTGISVASDAVEITGVNGTYTPTSDYKYFSITPTALTQLKSVKVYYKTSTGSETVATPTITNEKGLVTLDCSTTGATIMYHVGEAAVTDAAACTDEYKNEPFTVTKGQWVSAYAKKDGATASEVVSKQITWEIGNVTTDPAAVNEDITVTSGSVITFSAENADNLAFEVYGQPKVTKNNPYEYIATTDAIVTVTPMQEGKELTDKAAMFYINIKAVEPSENEEWTLVTDANQLSANATYIIAATNGSSSYGLATIAKSTRMDYVETTVTDDVIIDPESDLMRLKLEIDNSGTTPKYYWKTLNYAGGEQGYVSGSGPDDENKYNTDLKVLEANTYALTTVAVSNKNATITFTNNKSRVLAINLTSNNNYSFGCYASSNLGTSSYPYPRIYTNAGATRPVWRTTANGDVEILSTKGELHVMVFDEDGNQINNDGSKARALATDATWTNKVKEAGEIHTISKPAAGEGKILIQAKEVYNGIHSKEVKFSLASDGTTTGITAVEAEDADAPVEYYNMQGVRVMNPAQGLYIRRQGNRVEKVALR